MIYFLKKNLNCIKDFLKDQIIPQPKLPLPIWFLIVLQLNERDHECGMIFYESKLQKLADNFLFEKIFLVSYI